MSSKPAESSRGQAEASDLIARMRSELDHLAAFLEDEERAIEKKSPPPKRLARLRLVSEDVASAAKLSKKSAKN